MMAILIHFLLYFVITVNVLCHSASVWQQQKKGHRWQQTSSRRYDMKKEVTLTELFHIKFTVVSFFPLLFIYDNGVAGHHPSFDCITIQDVRWSNLTPTPMFLSLPHLGSTLSRCLTSFYVSIKDDPLFHYLWNGNFSHTSKVGSSKGNTTRHNIKYPFFYFSTQFL